MSGMPLAQALLLLAAVVVLVALIERRWLHPFLAIIAVASAFAIAAGFSTGFLGKTFGTGFAQAAYTPGLVIVAAAIVAALADRVAIPPRLRATRVAAPLGFIAGLAASPSAAFAILTPLRPARPVALALALSASHGLVFSPVVIAATAIIGAGWMRTVAIGFPVALLAAFVGVLWARRFPPIEPKPAPRERSGRLTLLAACAIPLLLLMIRSLGDLPSEPLGGGGSREMILGLGRPLILLLVAVGIMAIGLWRLSRALLADADWTMRVLGNVAPLLLTVAAAGGLQRLCQEAGMAELIGERLTGWHAGMLVPFLVAAAIKTLQGSSLVAAITAAGMIQPLLQPLGLDSETGRALATLAVGAGAMTVAHVNDEYFWLVTHHAGFGPLRGLAALTGGTLLQGAVAAAALMVAGIVI
jgi:GntP family gluconate:H+ symporter